jgi:hypothetical protein
MLSRSAITALRRTVASRSANRTSVALASQSSKFFEIVANKVQVYKPSSNAFVYVLER